MRRFSGKTFGAASLLGLAACLVSCTGNGRGAAQGGSDPASVPTSRGLVSWVEAPPEGCSVGSSGPTLNPRNAIRHARLAAIEALAAGSLEVAVQTISGDGSRGSFEISAQALSGTLEDARIVALWADTALQGDVRARVRQVYALACWPDAPLGALPRRGYPEWLIEPPREAGRICATGIAGPTWKEEDQRASALRDARLALAAALESRIEKRIYDDGRGAAKIARQIDPSPQALERAARADRLDRDWYDTEGTGPIGLPGVLYGLACIEG